jgi:hypothetical protein
MIRTDREYQDAVQQRDAQAARLVAYQLDLEKSGLVAEVVRRALDPVRTFHLQLVEEVEYYEQLKRGDPGSLQNLHGLGPFLVGLRIAVGLTQRELAARLKVDESQVSRDERHEYHGISVERAERVLDALRVQMVSQIRMPAAGQDPGAERSTT